MTALYESQVTSAAARMGLEAAVADARASERTGDWVAARRVYQRLLDDRSITAPTRSSVLRWMGRTYAEEGNSDVAVSLLEQAVEAGATAGDPGAEAHALNGLAVIEQTLGNLDRSEELYTLARVRAVEANDEMLLAVLDQNLGTIANIRGDLQTALESYESSRRRLTALGRSSFEAHVLNNIGMVCTDLGQWEDAEVAYVAACDACVRSGETGLLRRVEVNQAELWIARREITKARERCESLLQHASSEQCSSPWIGDVYKHYGVICREELQYDRADIWFGKAARVARDAHDLLLSAETAREQAELYWAQSRNTDTLQALNAAHTWFSQLRAERDLDAIARRNARLEERFLDVVRKWGESIESKDVYTQGHCVRVANVACALAELAGFDSKTLFWFRIGALLHDVGKLIVPVEVLNKPGRLNEEEWRIMKRHPEAGEELLADIEFPWDIRPMVRNHHERWDGCGYPDGLAGESIPMSARILCVADVYDALTTTRSYRSGFDHSRAVEIMIENNASGHFDPAVFDMFLSWADGYNQQIA
ncbi:MAG: HD domain-containing phosphohydrolase [Gemmatimonadaceae bacterium]